MRLRFDPWSEHTTEMPEDALEAVVGGSTSTPQLGWDTIPATLRSVHRYGQRIKQDVPFSCFLRSGAGERHSLLDARTWLG
jgi:hypothetical protein